MNNESKTVKYSNDVIDKAATHFNGSEPMLILSILARSVQSLNKIRLVVFARSDKKRTNRCHLTCKTVED